MCQHTIEILGAVQGGKLCVCNEPNMLEGCSLSEMGQAPAPGVNRPPWPRVAGFLLKERRDGEPDREPSH
ncbi:hypothetical protein ATANTOWER_030642 [Ataeniobius toweri]|uniref:Uncharacterized protein n=1 Tax=Ataeniobius toweri TaxID=208326 RepID=A0ABU7BP10_9TELE|nr:hypothetical protein [Ataeniobius toweri]